MWRLYLSVISQLCVYSGLQGYFAAWSPAYQINVEYLDDPVPDYMTPDCYPTETA